MSVRAMMRVKVIMRVMMRVTGEGEGKGKGRSVRVEGADEGDG